MSEHTQEIILKGCWIRPHTDITYLEEGNVTLEFKNNSNNRINIEEITCSFATDADLSPYESTLSTMISIKPFNISSPIRVPFLIDLKLSGGTNYAKIVVTYRVNKSPILKKVIFGNPDTRCVIIHPIHPAEKCFFISHKDPEDTRMSINLDHHLRKIGFTGYVAENDKRPGTDIWKEKIYPSIDDCVALIVLWTSSANNKSDTIFKEVIYAKEKQKRVILLVEKGLAIPEIFQGDKEYVQVENKVTCDDLVKLVENIEKTYRSGSFEI